MDDGLRPLVICYGNRLRSDDGVAWHVADRLAGDGRFQRADVLCRHQLTPELAENVSRATRVVLVDAATGRPPGTVERTVVEAGAAAVAGDAPRWSHELTPAALAGFTAAVFGRVPPMEVVSVAAATLAVGERLSEPVEEALARAADAVAAALGVGPPS